MTTPRKASCRDLTSRPRLSGGVSLNQSLDAAAEEGFADQGRVEEAAGRHGAVAEHDEVAGGRLG